MPPHASTAAKGLSVQQWMDKARDLAQQAAQLGRHSLGLRMALIVALGVLLVLGSTTLVVGWRASSALTNQSVEEISTAVDVGERLLATYDSSLRDTARRLYDTFLAFLPEMDVVASPDERIAIGEFNPPALYMGDMLLNGNDDPVDLFELATGGVATVFARDGDDFIRVSTSLRNANNLRAVGRAVNDAWKG